MKILVLNSGSSSIKFQLFDMTKNLSIANGLIEEIGNENSLATITHNDKSIEKKEFIVDHNYGLELMNLLLIESSSLKSLDELFAIGHRVVHGGHFSKPQIVDKSVEAEIERIIPLAPLHNKAHLAGIRVMRKLCPTVKQVTVFDTAFHTTMPQHAYMYALPYETYKKDGVRKYGFHGTSHHYVVKEAAKYLKKDLSDFNAISLHLGNGASMAAIKNGKCIDTTMGLTPLEGLIMGSRSGDLDPAILFYLSRKNNLNIDDLDDMLNKQSGLKGICGSNHMRKVKSMAKDGDKKAQLALDMFAYRIKKYIGAYIAAIGKIDCIIFTGGIGENDIDTRVRCCSELEHLGISIDIVKNNLKAQVLQDVASKSSNVEILVIPTNEELEIAIQTKELIK